MVGNNGNGLEEDKVTTGALDDGPPFPPFSKPLYKSVMKIRYNNLWYTSVEGVVSAIEAQFNTATSPYQPSTVELKPVQRGPKVRLFFKDWIFSLKSLFGHISAESESFSYE